jgi:hypothetical protein
MATAIVLQTWKEISAYVGRTERTLQRWEVQFGFPVHRPSGKSRSSVMALSQDIEEWTRTKPSLVSIRESSRLSPAKPSPVRITLLEQLKLSHSLREKQKDLRVNLMTLLQAQQQLCEKLRQQVLDNRTHISPTL